MLKKNFRFIETVDKKNIRLTTPFLSYVMYISGNLITGLRRDVPKTKE